MTTAATVPVPMAWKGYDIHACPDCPGWYLTIDQADDGQVTCTEWHNARCELAQARDSEST